MRQRRIKRAICNGQGPEDGSEGGQDGRTMMSQLRVAWRRAVDACAHANRPGLSAVLALLGPAAAASDWICDGVEALGPLADELVLEADAGPIHGTVLAELSTGITHTFAGAFEATRAGDDRPWLIVRIADGGAIEVATRSRELLGDLRRRFRDHPAAVGSALGED